MENGTKVYLKPTAAASGELHARIVALGNIVGEIAAKTESGVCTVLLPEGITIKGYSHPCGSGQRHYIDLHQSHLRAVP